MEREDDITLVALECHMVHDEGDGWQTLAELEVASAPHNERLAMERVAEAVRDVELPPLRLERLKTAVAEATMNAMEHGNQYRAGQAVRIAVRRGPGALLVRIVDDGDGPAGEAPLPDLGLKLEGLQTPRGWGLHLIRSMVDELREVQEDGRHVVELLMKL